MLSLLGQVSREQISTLLGYSSIASWLCAQVPQLYENYRLGSCEGLALPFLISWALGDSTNLIGCILTRQLPFQTYLAGYFVLVDIGLISQFTYYSFKNPTPKLPPFLQSHSHRHSHLPSRSGSRVAARRSSKRTRTRSGDQYSSRKVIDSNIGGYTSEDPMERSWVSESSSVAHSPASTRPSTRPNTRPNTIYNSHSRQPSLPRNSVISASNSSATTSNSNSQPPTPSYHSIHDNQSESRGRTLTRPTPPTRTSFFGPPLETISGSPASGSPAGILATHSIIGGRPVGGGGGGRIVGSTSSTSRTRTGGARRSTSMVFLSVGLLFSFNIWSSGSTSSPQLSSRDSVVVWSTVKDIIPVTENIRLELRHPILLETAFVKPIENSKREVPVFSIETKDESEDEDEDNNPPYPYPKRDFERFIGRASAWLCTSLYLTSRLPQIWQNFRRRSVEGLSMLLFVMAFVGNSLYVASILSNPLMSSPGYLLETTPYLLGSGGTLCFDMTIVFQSLLYSEKREEKRRSRVIKHSLGVEEEAATLLGRDYNNHHEDITDDDDDETGTLNGRNRRSAAASLSSRSGSRIGRSPGGNRKSSSLNQHKRSESTELSHSRKRWSYSPSTTNNSSPYHSESEGGGGGGGLISDQEFEIDSPTTLNYPHYSSSFSSNGNGKGKNVSRPTTLSGHEIDAIMEEGESAVTLRE